ncbi:hypothetical protein [Streptomyces clavuligerus]|uniref:Uncharacterized protein n=2 Tax=Streptomyces clavuligerus TaxID=1901 RepID=E2PUJ4_STRCL|nr:hypothetical protein [Streptomyces clavuligerus]ANW19432.1 hypothetical protein BB341_15005 [Streptomyces clavuligerus]AXU14039.1 hypothetical protein D1794_15650 [Streptomyces clavuligerus]EFG07773.1 Hypothetical protein SCLAV_2701 [Streptomyces clavuligerus]MBY6304020.1 hypothetical protein [Streptomyces clavuligerus]QCS06812.1 hypothetical protein CRV15_15005 [Streptomyces clavuligerus]
MNKTWAGAAALTAVLAVLAVLAVPAWQLLVRPAAFFLFEYGCRDREDRIAAAIAADPILSSPPPGSGRPESAAGCDDDDQWVHAGQEYTYTSPAATTAALSHYRTAAPSHGWTATPREDCYTKDVGGAPAYLSVTVLKGDRVSVDIDAAGEDGEFC